MPAKAGFSKAGTLKPQVCRVKFSKKHKRDQCVSAFGGERSHHICGLHNSTAEDRYEIIECQISKLVDLLDNLQNEGINRTYSPEEMVHVFQNLLNLAAQNAGVPFENYKHAPRPRNLTPESAEIEAYKKAERAEMRRIASNNKKQWKGRADKGDGSLYAAGKILKKQANSMKRKEDKEKQKEEVRSAKDAFGVMSKSGLCLLMSCHYIPVSYRGLFLA